MPTATVADTWDIREETRVGGFTTLCVYIGGQPAWVAYELIEDIGGYRWQIYPMNVPVDDRRIALVYDKATALSWLRHEAEHTLLATAAFKVAALAVTA